MRSIGRWEIRVKVNLEVGNKGLRSIWRWEIRVEVKEVGLSKMRLGFRSINTNPQKSVYISY